MKKFLFFTLLTTVAFNLFAQKGELRIGLNSGISHFRGNSAVSESVIFNDRTNSPFGIKPTISYGIAVDYRYVFRKHFFAGIGVGYENLRAKVNIDKNYSGGAESEATGEAFLNNHFLTGNPFVGYRFYVGKVSLDIIGGLDLSYLLKQKEKGEYKYAQGDKVKYSAKRDYNINMDIRPRVQASVSYSRFSLSAGYAWGLKNYYKGYDGGDPEAYLNTMRIGIQYKIF